MNEAPEIELLDHQYELYDAVFRDGYRYAALITGLGGGKSWMGAFLASVACRQFRAPGCIISTDYTTLVDSTLEAAKECWRIQDIDFSISLYGKKKRLILDGVPVFLRSAVYPEQIAGLPDIGWIWFDEASKSKNKKAFLEAVGRLRRNKNKEESEKWPMSMWITATPKITEGGFILKKFFIDDIKEDESLADERWIMHGIDSSQNIFLDDAYVNALDRDYDGKYKLQQKGGQFVQMEGAVWEPYISEPLFLTQQGKKKFASPVDISIDFGRRRPAVLFFTKLYDMKQRKVIDFIFDALMPENILVGNLITSVKDRLVSDWDFEEPEHAIRTIYGDPAGDSQNPHEYRSEFAKFLQAFPSAKPMYSHYRDYRSIEKGIIAVDNLFRKKELAIDKRLAKKNPGDYTDVVTALTCVQYPELKPGVPIREYYVKDGTFDHGADAARYWAAYQVLLSKREAA